MRAAIAGINDGKASFEDIVEHNGLEPCEIPICVQLEIRGDEIYASFDGTGEPGAGSVNAPWALTHSAIYYAVKSVIGSKIPTNAGAYRPIHLIRPKQPSIADTPFPHAVALCTNNPAQRIVDAAIGAFAKIVILQSRPSVAHVCASRPNNAIKSARTPRPSVVHVCASRPNNANKGAEAFRRRHCAPETG